MAFKNSNPAQKPASGLYGSTSMGWARGVRGAAGALGVALAGVVSMGHAVFSPAQAQEAASTVSLYARLAAGAAFVNDLDQDIAFDPNLVSIITPPDRQEISYDTGIVLGGALGFDYGNNFRTELEYRYIEADQDQRALSNGFSPDGGLLSVGDSSGQAIIHALLANVAYDAPLDGPVTPFVSLGFGGARVRNDLNGAFSPSDEAALTYAYQARAGVSYEVNEGLRLGVDYAYFATGQLTYGPEQFDSTAPTVEPRVDDDNFSASTVQFFVQKVF